MICCYEMRKGRGSCVEPSSLKNFGSMFDAEAIHAQIPSNIEPNYQRTWCNGHKTGHASVLSSYIANLPLVSPMFVLGLIRQHEHGPVMAPQARAFLGLRDSYPYDTYPPASVLQSLQCARSKHRLRQWCLPYS